MGGAIMVCTSNLFDVSLQGLENLFEDVSISKANPLLVSKGSYLKLDLGLGDVLLATATAGNLLGLGDLGTDGLERRYELVVVEMRW